MRRRTVLQAGGAATTLWLAGCAGRSDDPGDGGETEPTNDTPESEAESASTTTETDRETTSQPVTTATEPTQTGQELIAGDRGCGTGGHSATVDFDRTAGTVVITGTIGAPDPCHRPNVERVAYDEATGALAVTITAVEDDAGGVCASCLADLEYELRVSFEGGLPERVTVDHGDRESQRVTETARHE